MNIVDVCARLRAHPNRKSKLRNPISALQEPCSALAVAARTNVPRATDIANPRHRKDLPEKTLSPEKPFPRKTNVKGIYII